MLLDALMSEPARAVQGALLDALNARTLGAPELERLSGWVVAGQLAPGAEAALLNVLTPEWTTAPPSSGCSRPSRSVPASSPPPGPASWR